MFGKLDRYILKSILNPLAMALAVAAMLLTLERMLRLFDFVLDKNGPVDVVWQMLAYLLPHYLGLALPLGLFIGILMAFRGLSLSSELEAITASGVSMRRLLLPVYAITLVLMVVDFILVSYVQPYAEYRYRQLRFEVSSGALGISVPAGEFVNVAEGTTLFVGSTSKVSASGAADRRLKNIFLERRSPNGNRNVFTAAEGTFFAAGDDTTLIMRLFDGRQLQYSADVSRPAVLTFDKLDIPIELPQAGAFRARGGVKKEATIGELMEIVQSESPESFEQYNEFRASLHWRIIHPLTFLALPMLAISMGVANKRKPSPIQPIVGIALVIVYHEVLEEWGEVQVAAGNMSPWLAMWPIYVGFFALGAVLFRTTAESPGGLQAFSLGQTISAIGNWPSQLVRQLSGQTR